QRSRAGGEPAAADGGRAPAGTRGRTRAARRLPDAGRLLTGALLSGYPSRMRNAPREDVDVDTHVARAIEVAVDNVARGGGPFGAVILGPEGEVARGCNRVTPTLD